MVIVELLLKVVLVYVCDILKLKDLRIVCSLRVHLVYLFLNLSKLIFIVSSLDILITATSANIGSSALVLLLH